MILKSEFFMTNLFEGLNITRLQEMAGIPTGADAALNLARNNTKILIAKGLEALDRLRRNNAALNQRYTEFAQLAKDVKLRLNMKEINSVTPDNRNIDVNTLYDVKNLLGKMSSILNDTKATNNDVVAAYKRASGAVEELISLGGIGKAPKTAAPAKAGSNTPIAPSRPAPGNAEKQEYDKYYNEFFNAGLKVYNLVKSLVIAKFGGNEKAAEVKVKSLKDQRLKLQQLIAEKDNLMKGGTNKTDYYLTNMQKNAEQVNSFFSEMAAHYARIIDVNKVTELMNTLKEEYDTFMSLTSGTTGGYDE